MYCASLTELISLDCFGGNYRKFECYLYDFFLNKIKNGGVTFLGKPLRVRRHPEYDGKEESFFHLTCKEQYGIQDRTLDLRRSERLHWIPQVLNSSHFGCPDDCFKVYEKKGRLHLLNVEDRYIIVLEVRIDYVLLVTAFYIEHDHSLRKKIKEYDEFIDNI